MALNTAPSKRFYKAAAIQTAPWGTATACGALSEIICKGDGNPALKQAYESYQAIGRVMPKDGDLAEQGAIDFPVGDDLQYMPGAHGSLIAGFFGTTYAPVIVGDGPGYTHNFEFADYTEDIFTYITGRPGAVWEVPSAKAMKVSFKLGGGRLQAAVTMRGNTLTEAGTNGETQVNALTPEAEGNFVKAQQGVLRMNGESGDALDSGDIVANVSDVQIDLERTMDASTSLGGTYIADPAESNFKFTVKVMLSRAAAADVAYLSTFKTMTAQKMDLIFTGALIETGVPYKVTFGFPRLKFSGPPDCKLEDIIKNGLEFVAEEAASAPLGMTGHVRPYMEIVNTRSTAYVT